MYSCRLINEHAEAFPKEHFSYNALVCPLSKEFCHLVEEPGVSSSKEHCGFQVGQHVPASHLPTGGLLCLTVSSQAGGKQAAPAFLREMEGPPG